MAKFKKGDKVKVSLDSNLPTKGRIGIIDEDFREGSLYYRVRLEPRELKKAYFFLEKDLELVDQRFKYDKMACVI